MQPECSLTELTCITVASGVLSIRTAKTVNSYPFQDTIAAHKSICEFRVRIINEWAQTQRIWSLVDNFVELQIDMKIRAAEQPGRDRVAYIPRESNNNLSSDEVVPIVREGSSAAIMILCLKKKFFPA